MVNFGFGNMSYLSAGILAMFGVMMFKMMFMKKKASKTAVQEHSHDSTGKVAR